MRRSRPGRLAAAPDRGSPPRSRAESERKWVFGGWRIACSCRHQVMRWCIAIALSVSACGGAPRVVALVRPSGGPLASVPSGGVPLDIVSRSAAVAEPLTVRGSDVGYGDLQTALGLAITTATASWGSGHRDDVVARQGGWTLLVELTGADAQLEPGGRVVVSLDVRATMRTRSGNVYLGQTQLGCREGGLMSSDDGAPVVYRCLTRVGRDLAGWLSGGVRLEPPPDS
jgi:hypothetical protein